MKKIIWLLMLIIIADPLMGEVTAWVNKNPVMVGELFQLQVEAKNVDDPEEPDLGVIRGLEILNRSVQNKTSIVGSSFTSTVSWTYVLIAPAAGEYQIPPLKVGKEKTAPILLKAVESALKSKHESVRLEVVTEPEKVYPQQQVEQWLRKIPDDPGRLLRNKMKREYQRRDKKHIESKQYLSLIHI